MLQIRRFSLMSAEGGYLPGRSFVPPARSSGGQRGFSLIELLVILAIVAVLAVGSSLMLGNRQSGAVRALMDDLEGSIVNAFQAANASSRDIALVGWGGWEKDNPMRIAYGEARILNQSSEGAANFMKIVDELMAGKAATEITVPGAEPSDIQTVAVAFYYSPTDSNQRRAAVVVDGSGNWDSAIGNSDRIETVPPFTTEFSTVLTATNNFCMGQSDSVTSVSINGLTKRFTRTAFIQVVTTNSSGGAMSNAPMGLIVLREGSASVSKFYNPGTEHGDGKWRKL